MVVLVNTEIAEVKIDGQEHEEYAEREVEKAEIEVLVVDEKDHGPREDSVFRPQKEHQFSEDKGSKEQVEEDDDFFSEVSGQESTEECKEEMRDPVGDREGVYGEKTANGRNRVRQKGFDYKPAVEVGRAVKGNEIFVDKEWN
jgi:hypothetical protein